MGIDLGTSSVKIICIYPDGKTQKSKAEYDEISPKGWCDGVVRALSAVDTSSVCAIGLSSQVGTYIVNEKDVISWRSTAGADELNEIKSRFTQAEFIKEISMPHPDIISYPIPRLKYIRKKYKDGASVCQPKDIIGRFLTGNYATDQYSWRGLANMETGTYSRCFLVDTGNPRLPDITDYRAMLGKTTADTCRLTGIPEGTPVYIGLNDFFASLMGMGLTEAGDIFDITGTSEHLGIITDGLVDSTSMVSGPYTDHFVHYGVTASSGASLDFGLKNFGFDRIELTETLVKSSPIFTPYLNGERAPVFDSNATGTFFGITTDCTNEILAYSVLEGVVFSIYHIYENLGSPSARRMRISGGAADSGILNLLKSELFNLPAIITEEKDTSALGAAMVAAIGDGAYSDIRAASEDLCRIKHTVNPTGNLRPLMLRRYEIYKELYPSLKNTYKKFKEVQL